MPQISPGLACSLLGSPCRAHRPSTLSGSCVSCFLVQACPRIAVQTTTARQGLCSTPDLAPSGGPRSSTGREGPTTRPPTPTRSPAQTPVSLLLRTTTSANEGVCCFEGSWAVWQRAQHSPGLHASLQLSSSARHQRRPRCKQSALFLCVSTVALAAFLLQKALRFLYRRRVDRHLRSVSAGRHAEPGVVEWFAQGQQRFKPVLGFAFLHDAIGIAGRLLCGTGSRGRTSYQHPQPCVVCTVLLLLSSCCIADMSGKSPRLSPSLDRTTHHPNAAVSGPVSLGLLRVCSCRPLWGRCTAHSVWAPCCAVFRPLMVSAQARTATARSAVAEPASQLVRSVSSAQLPAGWAICCVICPARVRCGRLSSAGVCLPCSCT